MIICVDPVRSNARQSLSSEGGDFGDAGHILVIEQLDCHAIPEMLFRTLG